MSGINSFTLAARKVNPNFKTKVIWINTWYDPAKEADAARALIDQGVDVMTQHTDSPAAVQVCESKGIPTFGQGADQSQFAPDHVQELVARSVGPFYTGRTQAVLDGTWKPEDTYWGIKEGALDIAPIINVPDDVKAAGEKVKAGWMDGSYDVYAGPIKEQDGTVKAAGGRRARRWRHPRHELAGRGRRRHAAVVSMLGAWSNFARGGLASPPLRAGIVRDWGSECLTTRSCGSG